MCHVSRAIVSRDTTRVRSGRAPFAVVHWPPSRCSMPHSETRSRVAPKLVTGSGDPSGDRAMGVWPSAHVDGSPLADGLLRGAV